VGGAGSARTRLSEGVGVTTEESFTVAASGICQRRAQVSASDALAACRCKKRRAWAGAIHAPRPTSPSSAADVVCTASTSIGATLPCPPRCPSRCRQGARPRSTSGRVCCRLGSGRCDLGGGGAPQPRVLRPPPHSPTRPRHSCLRHRLPKTTQPTRNRPKPAYERVRARASCSGRRLADFVGSRRAAWFPPSRCRRLAGACATVRPNEPCVRR
jgi:hypothetical protein